MSSVVCAGDDLSVVCAGDDLSVVCAGDDLSVVCTRDDLYSVSVVSSVVCAGYNQPADDEVEEYNGVESEGLPPLRLTLHQERHRRCNKKTYVLI